MSLSKFVKLGADGRYELVKETNMVDYVESLYNGAKDAGASVEAIGMFSLTPTSTRS
jgi:hypothetical protein